MVVEDEDTVRQVTSTVLELSGYHVLSAADGKEALILAADRQEPIDLLITDLIMPHLSGREVSERLTALRPELRVLFMSAYTDDSVVRQHIRSSDVNFIQKPFRLADLTGKVREILDGPIPTRVAANS